METTPLIRKIAAKYCDVDKLGVGRVTNKLLKNVIISAQNGTLKQLIEKYYPGKLDAVKPDYVEKEEAPSAGDTSVSSFIDNSGVVDVLPGVSRDVDESLKVFQLFGSAGITDEKLLPILEKLGGGFVDVYENLEHVCSSAPLADIKAIINAK